MVVEPFETGRNISVIGALTLNGVRAPMMIEGAIDGQVLELYIRHFLAPQLRPGDVMIWDNVPTHKSANVLALIEATGAKVEPLPAYSPDFDPKEGCISKVKAELKRVKANTVRKLRNALRRVRQSDFGGYSRLVSALWLFRSLNAQIESALRDPGGSQNRLRGLRSLLRTHHA